jgi:arylsulfatase A-like enzyme
MAGKIGRTIKDSTPWWPEPPAPPKGAPNILVVLFDDVGFTDFGAYGSDSRTPHIDALARRGAMLSRYYTSPFCGPSRAMLVTGMDNHQTGMGTLVETVKPELHSSPGYRMTWDRGQKTIGSLLSAAGYQTYVTGKWGIGETGANLPSDFGFQRSYVMDATGGSNYDRRPYLPGYDKVSWFEDGKPVELPKDFYSSRSLVDKMIQYIDAGKGEQPFFAFLSLQAVHIPVQSPVDLIDAYNGTFDRGWDAMRAERHQRAIKLGLVPPTTTLAPVPDVHRKWDDLSADDRKRAARKMQISAGMMEAADQHIGRLLKHLEAAGELENTIVVITSDNGPESADTDFAGLAGAVIGAVNTIEGTDQSFENLGQPSSLSAIGPEWASVSAAPFNLYKFYASEGGLRVPLVVAVLLLDWLRQSPELHLGEAAKLVVLMLVPPRVTVPLMPDVTSTVRPLPDAGTVPVAETLIVKGRVTLIRAPTRIPVLVSNRLIGTSVGPVLLIVPMKVDVPGPLRNCCWVVVNWEALTVWVTVIGVAAIAALAMPTAAMPEIIFANLFT